MRGCLLSWIPDFLTNRTYSVKIGETFSTPEKITSGVPQGSVLGPLLFLIFIDDLPLALLSGAHCFLFADDVKIFSYNNTSLLQSAIKTLVEWAKKRDLPIASYKTQILRLSKSNPKLPIFISPNRELQKSGSVRDLGIIISDSLHFTNHVDYIVAKANFRANLMLREFHTTDLSVLTRLFKTYARSILEYATQIWAPSDPNTDVCNANNVENVQIRFTKRILSRLGKRNTDYDERLAILKLETLELCRVNSDLATVYCIVNGPVDLPFDEFFSVSRSVGRLRSRHELVLAKPLVRNNLSLYSFSSRVINWWNSLPSSVVSALTLEMFKRRLRDISPGSLPYLSLIR